MHRIKKHGNTTWSYRGIWFTSDNCYSDNKYFIMTPDTECYADTTDDVKSMIDQWIKMNGPAGWYNDFQNSKWMLTPIMIDSGDREKIQWAKKHNACFEVIQDSLVTDVLI